MHTICPRSLVIFIFIFAIFNRIDKTSWTYSIIINIDTFCVTIYNNNNDNGTGNNINNTGKNNDNHNNNNNDNNNNKRYQLNVFVFMRRLFPSNLHFFNS